MNADEARTITQESLNGPVIDKYIEYIDIRIRKAATEGKNNIINPQSGSAENGFYFWLNPDEKKAVRLHYEQNGFTWEDHPDPDPGHPCGGPYTTLAW